MAGQQDGFALGVDLGTSNTVAVLRWPDGRTRPLLVDGQPILPSGVYADPSGQLHVGRDAQRLAQADPNRFEANPKRRVDESTVLLGDRGYDPAELLAAILRAVAEAAVAAVGFLPPAVLTCPATWDDARRQVLADALVRAGWPPAAEHTLSGPTPPGTRLLREPVAAARYYTEVLRRPVPVGSAIAVFDFGGGTLDVAVVRNEGADPWGDSGFRVITAGGVADLGGLDLDAALLTRLGERLAVTHPADWARLTRPENATQWRDRLQLWEGVRGAKEMLSRTMVAPVAVPGVETAAQVTREDLEGVAAPLLRRAVAETRQVIAAAGLSPEQLAGLFLVGGSSRMPLVARMLHAKLGVAPTVLEQPELPVAEGALTDLPVRRLARAPMPVPAATAPAGPGSTPRAAGPVGPGGTPVAVGPAGTLRAGPEAPARTVPDGPTLPAAAGPASPALGVPVSGVPVSPPGGGPTGATPHRRRARWMVLGAALALAGVVTATVVYLTRDRYPDLEFHTLDEPTRIAAGADRPGEMWTALLDDHAYLAYPLDDDRLEVVAVDAGTRRELWRRQVGTSTRKWAGIVAVPGAVAVYADASGDSTPRDLVVLDAASGKQRWTHPVHGDDEVFFAQDVAVLVDRTGGRLAGLRLGDGTQKWARSNPRDEYDNVGSSVHPVTRDEAAGGPAFADGAPRDPWQDEPRQLVQVGADRSIRLIDMSTGAVVRSRTNVADRDDFVVAHEDRLYVANDDGGYRLLSYDLKSLAEPTVLYTAPDDRRRPKALVSCGEHRACLLEVPGSDAARTEVVAAAEGKRTTRWKAPNADQLVPLGEHLLAGRRYPEATATLFGPDGKVLYDRKGTAVKLDAGNLLAFAEPLGSSEGDRSVAGVWAESGTMVALGQLEDVRSESCSWNTELIACGAAKDFVLHRFAGDR